jgi:ATP-binding cassette subfamily B (MDR/TAP) protein 1
MQTLYTGTIRFNILLGAIKPVSEVTQEEIVRACRNANILDFINSLPEFVVMPCLSVCLAINGRCYQFRGFDTEVGGKGAQLSGGQKRMSNVLQPLPVTLTVPWFRTHCYCPCPAPESKNTFVR